MMAAIVVRMMRLNFALVLETCAADLEYVKVQAPPVVGMVVVVLVRNVALTKVRVVPRLRPSFRQMVYLT